jgi:hypothetical protein
MPNYRLYCYDGADKVWSAEWLQAASDEEAIATAQRMDVGIKCEVWEGQRLVATIERQSKTSVPLQAREAEAGQVHSFCDFAPGSRQARANFKRP